MPADIRASDEPASGTTRAGGRWRSLPFVCRCGIMLSVIGAAWWVVQSLFAPGSVLIPLGFAVVGVELILFGIAFG